MKNTRKKMLLSSIAMLLVALVALGSATYAWYTSNPNANATGLKLKASASKGLVIQTATHGAKNPDFWGHTDYLKYDETTQESSTTPVILSPVSFAPATSMTDGYTVEADKDDNYKAKDNTNTADATGTEYYQENIKCKLTGAADASDVGALKLKTLTINTVSGVKQVPGLRVAIQYNGNLIGVYAPSARSNKTLTAAKTAYSSALSSEAYSFAAASTVSNVALGSVHQDGSDIVTVTVYLDGEDSAVFSQNVEAANLITSVDVALTVQ